MNAPGDVVRGYRIVRTLGRGGLGTTFEATRERTGEVAALKRLAVAQVDDWKRLELFEREALVLSRLTHGAIPAYLEHFTVDGPAGPTLYIAQELIDGQSLAEVVMSGAPLDELEVRRIAEEVLHVLDYLGRQMPPVIHRDIKPENLLRRPDGRIALVDFGAARAEFAKPQGGSTTVGTYGYMAPEQLHGVATPATDIYGLACTLLFLLTGRSPAELPRKKLKIDVAAAARVTRPFARWLEKALEPAAEERFLSAASALAALRGLPGGGGPPVDFGNASNRLPRVLALALVGTLAVTAIGAGALFALGRTPVVTSSGQVGRGQPFTTLPPRWKSSKWAPSIKLVRTIGAHMSAVFSVAVSPSGDRIASSSNDGTVKIWDAKTGETVRSLPGHTGRVGGVVWSPDGSLVVSSGDATVLAQDATTGTLRRTFQIGGPATGVDVSADGKRIVAGSLTGTARVWSLDSGAEVASLKHQGRALTAKFSPDGRYVATSGTKGFRLWDASTGAAVSKLAGQDKDMGGVAWAPDGRIIAGASDDHTVRTWMAVEAQELWRASDASDEVWNVAVDPRGKYVAAVGKDGWLRVYDAMSGTVRGAREMDKHGLLSVTWGPEGDTIVTGDASGKVELLTMTFKTRADEVPAIRADAPPVATGKTPAEDAYYRASEILFSHGVTASVQARAEAILREAMKAKASDEETALLLVGLARATEDRDGRQASDALLDRALKLARSLAEAHVQHGWFAYLRKDDVQAKQDAELADKLGPSGRSKNLLAALASRAKNIDEAERYAREALAIEPRSYATYSYQIIRDVWQARGDWDAVERAYERSVEANPADAWAKGNLAGYLTWRGKYDRAIELARAALKQMDYGAGHATLAQAFTEKGGDALWLAKTPAAAKKDFDDAIAAQATYPNAHYGLGAYFREQAFEKHDVSLLAQSNDEFDKAAKLETDKGLAQAARAENDRMASRVGLR